MIFKKYIKLLSIFLLLFVLVGCVETDLTINSDVQVESPVDIVEDRPEIGGQIIIPMTSFSTLNPLITENNSYYALSQLIFEGLFKFDTNLEITAQLVESYEVKDEGKTIDIKLLEDVYWHDGERLKASDVEFTIEAIKASNADNLYKSILTNNLGTTDLKKAVAIKVLDDRNLTISFNKSFSNYLEVLTFPIIPKHIFQVSGAVNKSYEKALAVKSYQPIGTGPFKFANYDNMKELKLVANEDYREGRPFIDSILGRVLSKEEDMLTAFETGQVNMAITSDVDWNKYEQNSRINIFEFVSSNYEFLGFNFEKEIFSNEDGKTIRQAIVQAINRQVIIEENYLGHGTQIDSPVHPNSWLFLSAEGGYGYNLEKAKELINGLGWKDLDGDGILEDLEGNKVSFKLLTNTYNLYRSKTAYMIKNDLQELGIEINIYPLEKYEDNISDTKIQEQWTNIEETLISGDYDIAFLGWELSTIPDLNFAFNGMNINTTSNFINYNNEKINNILNEISTTVLKEEKLKGYYSLQENIMENLPYISLFFKNKALLVDSKIKGELNPTFFNPYRGLENCYIPSKLQ